MNLNFLAILVASIIPMVIGFIWYNPKVFGLAWMRSAGMTEEKMKSGNMAVIFGVSILLSFLLAFSVNGMVVHQFGALQMIGGDPTTALPSYQSFMNDYGTTHRSFGHGALHGGMSGIFFVLPLLGINALFERKSWKYILVNTGYWTVTLAIMGSILCGWQ